MKALTLVVVAMLASQGCKKTTTADCGDAIGKGVDQIRERRKHLMAMRTENLSGSAKTAADTQAKMMERFSAELKTTLAKRCVDDRWPADVIDCYQATASSDEMRKCRNRLPAAVAARARVEEVNLMKSEAEDSDAGVPVQQGPVQPGSSAPDTTGPGDAATRGSAAVGSGAPK